MALLPTDSLLEAKVYSRSGTLAGRIEELILDPASGVVRFANLRTCEDAVLLLPWAAITFREDRDSFILTNVGEGLWSRAQ